jgi:hypothetical protein
MKTARNAVRKILRACHRFPFLVKDRDSQRRKRGATAAGQLRRQVFGATPSVHITRSSARPARRASIFAILSLRLDVCLVDDLLPFRRFAQHELAELCRRHALYYHCERIVGLLHRRRIDGCIRFRI